MPGAGAHEGVVGDLVRRRLRELNDNIVVVTLQLQMGLFNQLVVDLRKGHNDVSSGGGGEGGHA